MDHLGKMGFGATMTCRRDRLPSGVAKHYFHHEKGAVDQRNKAARFINPITAVKKVPPSGEDSGYTRVHSSMQSTGSMNFSTAGAINADGLYILERSRGIAPNKYVWGIECSDARQLYLGSYGQIDTIDSLIARCNIQYRCRKYWHSEMLHGVSLGIVTAYDMYKECASGSLCEEWKVEKPMTFHQFRDRLSTQMLTYRYVPHCLSFLHHNYLLLHFTIAWTGQDMDGSLEIRLFAKVRCFQRMLEKKHTRSQAREHAIRRHPLRVVVSTVFLLMRWRVPRRANESVEVFNWIWRSIYDHSLVKESRMERSVYGVARRPLRSARSVMCHCTTSLQEENMLDMLARSTITMRVHLDWAFKIARHWDQRKE